METVYSSAAAEARWRARWEELAVGLPSEHGGQPYTIALPPPNITGELHSGHAVSGSIQDTLVRYQRMRGRTVEWCPGTDHAALATNSVIERQLRAEGTSREEIGRDAFDQRVNEWYVRFTGRIYDQMKGLGFTCDWSRARFTMDEPYVAAIREVFKRLYDEGLIYRGPRIVNWCPHCRSAISDEEIAWQEHSDLLYRISYPAGDKGAVEVATVRPETMLGDTAVAVAPGDERYAHLVGVEVKLPITGRLVPVIADSAVDMGFGTGALKVTPAHSLADYEIGERHQLPLIQVVSTEGRLDVPSLPQFHGLTVEEGREKVVAELMRLGAISGQDEYQHSVAHCDRCGTVIEPLVSEQWWVRMTELARPAVEAVERGEVHFHPSRYADVYLAWMGNLRDWCISRQIWLGHAVPVSTCSNGHRFAWVQAPERCPECGAVELHADPDVLDTWFSSALWPFAIFGWPADTPDMERFYPTSTLVTAREIIHLWVARMVMLGYHFTGKSPFADVVINSTILAADGTRMSKSKGNGVEPLAMVERYGADAVRAWAAAVGTATQDVRFDEEKLGSYQRFANKLWNVTRFLVMRLGDGEQIPEQPLVSQAQLLAEDQWIQDRIAACVASVTRSLDGFRTHEAMERLYDTIWHLFCDWYVELAKPRLSGQGESRDAAAHTLVSGFHTLLCLLHPFMPFITEECAQRLPATGKTLDWAQWPAVQEAEETGSAVARAVDGLTDFVQTLRAAVQQAGIERGGRPFLQLSATAAGLEQEDCWRLLLLLAPVTRLDTEEDGAEGRPGQKTVPVAAGGFQGVLWLPVSDQAQRERNSRLLKEVTARLERVTSQLDSAAFVSRARPEVVERARQQRDELASQRAELEASLAVTADE